MTEKKFDQIAYIADYNKSKYDRIEIKVPKGMKADLQARAKAEGLSLTEYIVSKLREGK